MWWWRAGALAQTTIDYYSFREKREPRARRAFRNPRDLGWVRNWQETFDERGKYWWVTWAARGNRAAERTLSRRRDETRPLHETRPASGRPASLTQRASTTRE